LGFLASQADLVIRRQTANGDIMLRRIKRVIGLPLRLMDIAIGQRKLAVSRARLHDGSRPQKRFAAIIPPALPGSVGDAAMVSAAAEVLRAQGYERVDLFYGGEWPLDVKIDHRLETDSYFYGNSRSRYAELVSALADYAAVVFVGADVIDGAYNPGSVRRRLALVEDAAASGRIGVILGASYNETPDAGLETFIRDLHENVVICARDPVSRDRMEKAFNRPIVQTADVAFLLSPRPEHPDAIAAIDWISSRRRDGDAVIGFNVNYLQVNRDPNLFGAQAEAARLLIENGRSLILVSQDSRTSQSDAVLARKLVDSLPPHMRNRTYVLETVSPGAIKAALGQVDILVTGRLHALILALGAGTPGIALAYQGKFEGLYNLLDLPIGRLLTFPTSVVTDPASVLHLTNAALRSVDELRAKVAKGLPTIQAMSNMNFKSTDVSSPL
jgi:polysaccharide pyruvyl transferase WcaK-like protein